jgi:hypothetical protein
MLAEPWSYMKCRPKNMNRVMPILLYRAQIGNIILNPSWVLYNTSTSQFKNACNRTKYSSSVLPARIIASIPAGGLSYMCENKTKCVNWSSKHSWMCVHLAHLDSTSLTCVTRISTDHGQRLCGCIHPEHEYIPSTSSLGPFCQA